MWWAVLLRGVALILFGVLAYFWLGASLASLALLFVAYALVDGLLSVAGAIFGGGLAVRTGMGLAALASLTAASAVLYWRSITVPILENIIGAWAMALGVVAFASALTLRKVMQRDWSLVMIAGVSVFFGAMLLIQPGFDARTLVRLLSGFALVVGLLLTFLGFRFLNPPRP
jgi:uncharacterized membrane protein HdeD (DUF308 family)